MSKNKISKGYTSPDRELSEGDIKRKQKKLNKTLNQLEGLTEGTRKHHRKSFKAEKTLDQVETGRSGIRPNKSALNMLGIQPKSPLNQNDSIAAVKAWDKFKSGYMNRTTHPATGKPIDSTYNKKEYDMEKNEFYYDTDRNKLRLVPTDDGEIPIEGFKKGLKKWQLPPIDNN